MRIPVGRLAAGLLLVLAAPGCRHAAVHRDAWTWPGANAANTMLYSGRGTRPARVRYVRAWDAERLAEPGYICGPVCDACQSGLRTADINNDGALEIVVGSVVSAPVAVLSANGLPLAGRGRGSAALPVPAGPGARVCCCSRPGDSVRCAVVPALGLDSTGRAPSGCLFTLNSRPAVFEPEAPAAPGARYPGYALRVRSPADSGAGWTIPVAPRPFLWAVADVNSDGRDELLFGTQGEEHGLRVGTTTDFDSCFCICADEGGRILWQTAFGAHPFSGCRVCAADLDGDRRPEVVVAWYTWDNTGGGLAVLDGASGRVLASVPGPDSVPASHVSVGCADIDGDGRTEVVTTAAGKRAGVGVYRFEGGRLVPVAWRAFPSRSGEWYCRLEALADLDGDGRTEIVMSATRQTWICTDPVFYPSRFDSSEVLVLEPGLATRQELPLAAPCVNLVVGDLVPGGNPELLVATDRLTLYSTDPLAGD